MRVPPEYSNRHMMGVAAQAEFEKAIGHMRASVAWAAWLYTHWGGHEDHPDTNFEKKLRAKVEEIEEWAKEEAPWA